MEGRTGGNGTGLGSEKYGQEEGRDGREAREAREAREGFRDLSLLGTDRGG
ncbi:MAG: hypothetical protein LBQ12_07635 [Deltaproteobacteria bacterium]|nr:hypothetical protein [Deltaproteobacteria bacterium]